MSAVSALPLAPIWSILITTTISLGGFLLLRPLLHRSRAFHLLTLGWILVSLRVLIPVGFNLPLLTPWLTSPAVVQSPALSTTLASSSFSSPERTGATITAEIPPVIRPNWTLIGLLTWAAGALFVLTRQWRSHRALSHCIAHSTPVTSPRLRTIVDRLASQVGVRSPVRLRESEDISSPVICGFRHPYLLIPRGQEARLSDDELSYVVLHELGHWRHGDLHVQRLLRLACAFHWFNPLVWLALRAFHHDCELTSDHFVIRHTSPAETSAYGATMLKIFGWMRGQKPTPTTTALGVVDSSQQLKHRIKILISPPTRSLPRTVSTGTLFVAVVVLTILRPALAIDAPADTIITVAPKGWHENGNDVAPYTFGVDFSAVHHQPKSAYVKSDSAGVNKFGGMMQRIVAPNYAGGSVRLSGAVKSQDTTKGARLWMRVDGPVAGNSFTIDNMSKQPVAGGPDWTEYTIVLDVPDLATAIAYGFFISETGAAWVNDFKFEVVETDVEITGVVFSPQERLNEPTNLKFYPLAQTGPLEVRVYPRLHFSASWFHP